MKKKLAEFCYGTSIYHDVNNKKFDTCFYLRYKVYCFSIDFSIKLVVIADRKKIYI